MADAALAVQEPEPPAESGMALETLVGWFEDAEEASQESRKLAERDRDYYDGDQWTEAERKILRDRNQPDIVNNEIQRKIDFLTGFEATQRTDPKAFPRNPDDEAAAEAATDMLRYQETASDLDQLFSDVWENMLIEGFGGVEVLGPKVTNPKVIDVVLWHWDRLFFDPHSRKHDFSDARYFGGVMWMDADEAKRAFPDAEDDIETAIDELVSDTSSTSDTLGDRPASKVWARGGKRPRVRIVQMYYRDGSDWYACIFTKGGKIASQRIEFLDENGEPDCPMILQSAYVDRNNDRYGMVRQLIGPQDEINKRSSKALHLISVSGVVYEEGALDNVETFRTELAKPDGAAKVNAGGLEKIRLREGANQAAAAANLQMLQEAKESIQLKGPNAALQGKQGASASGRAIRASQEGGIIEMARLRDRHSHFKRRVYRAIWNRVRQFITDETWVRVTDNEQNLKFVGFNRQVTFAEQAAKELAAQGVPEAEIDAAVIALARQQGIDPNSPIKGKENVPAEIDCDILIENATESVTIQEEQFQMLVELAGAGVQFPPAVYIKASSLRNKDELLDMLEPDPAEKQIEGAVVEAEVKAKEAETAEKEASAEEKRSKAALNMAKMGIPPPPPQPQPVPSPQPAPLGAGVV